MNFAQEINIKALEHCNRVAYNNCHIALAEMINIKKRVNELSETLKYYTSIRTTLKNSNASYTELIKNRIQINQTFYELNSVNVELMNAQTKYYDACDELVYSGNEVKDARRIYSEYVFVDESEIPPSEVPIQHSDIPDVISEIDENGQNIVEKQTQNHENGRNILHFTVLKTKKPSFWFKLFSN